MNKDDIPGRRLYSQRLAGNRPSSAAKLLGELGAMQAQDHNGGKWSIGIRLPGVTDDDVERAIFDRSIVRTWTLRGTLHFVAPESVQWMLDLLGKRLIAGARTIHERNGLDDATVSRARDIFGGALRDNFLLNRPAMMDLLERNGISTKSQRGYQLLWRCAMEGMLCLGPMDGKQHTFTLLDNWLPERPKLDKAEALGTLARQYFSSHGPVTLADFIAWSGLTAANARIGLSLNRSSLEELSIDGQSYWMAASNAPAPDAGLVANLLAGFDELVLGYRDRTIFVDHRFMNRIVPGSNGVFMPTLTLNGRVTGTWKRLETKNNIMVEVRPFRSLSKDEIAAVEEAAANYGDFLGREVNVTIIEG